MLPRVSVALALMLFAPSFGHAQDAQRVPQSERQHTAYVYALRCFVIDGSFGDEPGSHLAFDAAMKLGRLQNFTNRQLNADLDHWTAVEQIKALRDPNYKQQMLDTCRKLGFAS